MVMKGNKPTEINLKMKEEKKERKDYTFYKQVQYNSRKFHT